VQSPCAHHVSLRAERIMHNVSQACDVQPDRTNVFFYHEASGDRRRGVRYARKPQRTRGTPPRRALRLHDFQRTSRKLSVHAAALFSPCANFSPTILPRSRRTLRSHGCQRASSKLGVQKCLKRGLGRKEAAAYATLARMSTRIT
jgi:hypothetical protein